MLLKITYYHHIDVILICHNSHIESAEIHSIFDRFVCRSGVLAHRCTHRAHQGLWIARPRNLRQHARLSACRAKRSRRSRRSRRSTWTDKAGGKFTKYLKQLSSGENKFDKCRKCFWAEQMQSQNISTIFKNVHHASADSTALYSLPAQQSYSEALQGARTLHIDLTGTLPGPAMPTGN